MASFHAALVFGKYENPYREAAIFAEGDLTVDLGYSADTSLRGIRDVVTSGGGGPAYLSDGVWL